MVESIGQQARSVAASSQAAPVVVPARVSTQDSKQPSTDGQNQPRTRDVVQVGSDSPAQRKAQGARTLHQVRDEMAKIELLAALTPRAAAQGLKVLALTLASAAETYASAGKSIDVKAEIRQLEAQLPAAQTAPAPQPGPDSGAEKQADEQFAAEVDQLQRQLDAQFQGLAVAAREEDYESAIVTVKQYGEASLATSGALATIANWHAPGARPETPALDVTV